MWDTFTFCRWSWVCWDTSGKVYSEKEAVSDLPSHLSHHHSLSCAVNAVIAAMFYLLSVYLKSAVKEAIKGTYRFRKQISQYRFVFWCHMIKQLRATKLYLRRGYSFGLCRRRILINDITTDVSLHKYHSLQTWVGVYLSMLVPWYNCYQHLSFSGDRDYPHHHLCCCFCVRSKISQQIWFYYLTEHSEDYFATYLRKKFFS